MLLCAVCMLSCNDTDRHAADGKPYHLSGRIVGDSITTDSCLTLFVDRHSNYVTAGGDSVEAFEAVELPVVNGSFSYAGNVPVDVDELTLSGQGLGSISLFAESGSDIQIEVTGNRQASFSESDTLNHWISLHRSQLLDMDKDLKRRSIDSLCQVHRTEIRAALLLREMMTDVNDSIFMRRMLGKIDAAAKPGWLMQDINERFDIMSHKLDRNFRLPKLDIPTADSVFSLQASRSEALVLYFWADYDSASIDSMKVLREIARDYGLYEYANTYYKEKSAKKSRHPRRIEIMTVCLHASDSASWLSTLGKMPGRHAWLQGGFAHMLPTSCLVSELPVIYCFDRFSNYQNHGKWNKDLYSILDRANINSSVKESKSK